MRATFVAGQAIFEGGEHTGAIRGGWCGQAATGRRGRQRRAQRCYCAFFMVCSWKRRPKANATLINGGRAKTRKNVEYCTFALTR